MSGPFVNYRPRSESAPGPLERRNEMEEAIAEGEFAEDFFIDFLANGDD